MFSNSSEILSHIFLTIVPKRDGTLWNGTRADVSRYVPKYPRDTSSRDTSGEWTLSFISGPGGTRFGYFSTGYFGTLDGFLNSGLVNFLFTFTN